MSSPEEVFILECGELLTSMEEALLELEANPEDAESIATIFRATHTIKGNAGVFGFDDLEAFNHVVESVLDKVRDNETAIDSNLIAILLSCRDHMEVLVEKSVSANKITAEDKEVDKVLVDKLNAYSNHEDLVKGTEAETKSNIEPQKSETQYKPQGSVVISDNWHISVRFNKDVLKNGMDPLSIMQYLQKIGEIIHVTTLHDELPEVEVFDPELCYLGFEINYSSDASKEEIEQVFEFVADMCKLYILPPKALIEHYAEVIHSLPEDDMQIGEILIASGVLTQRELDFALNKQKNLAEDNEEQMSPIGEVLVETKVVPEEVLNVALSKQSSVNLKKPEKRTALRVDAEKLDKLINLVGELVIARATANMLSENSGDEQLIESMSNMSHLIEDIRDNALDLRMVQIGETFNRFKRIVRDVSKELGKDIKLNIQGADAELDKTVVEKIGDPLMHLIRNAMDHGIEESSVRVSAGKNSQGNVWLNAFHDSGNIVIEVADDGRGLNREVILAKALEKDLISDGQILTDHEVFLLVFEAGFSTAKEVTNLSGRGVGMDVVRKNIESLRGSVDIYKNEHGGTTVSIRLPLTLAIIDGFLVRVGDSSYVIPLDMVNECIELGKNEQDNQAVNGYIDLRDEVLPFVRLNKYFDEPVKDKGNESIVVVKNGANQVGFVVDELLGELQTVIKPMGKVLQNVKGISGATILGSGKVAIILDVPSIVNLAVRHSTIAAIDQSSDDQLLH